MKRLMSLLLLFTWPLFSHAEDHIWHRFLGEYVVHSADCHGVSAECKGLVGFKFYLDGLNNTLWIQEQFIHDNGASTRNWRTVIGSRNDSEVTFKGLFEGDGRSSANWNFNYEFKTEPLWFGKRYARIEQSDRNEILFYFSTREGTDQTVNEEFSNTYILKRR